MNGQKLDELSISKKGVYDLKIPRELTRSGKLDIVFQTPDAISPKQLGIGSDNRTLGIAFRAIRIAKN